MMRNFLREETGAVTVDWVVLTAALVGLGLATMAVVSSGVEDVSGDIDDQLKGQVIKTSFAPAAAGDAYTNYEVCDTATYNNSYATYSGYTFDETVVETQLISNVGNLASAASTGNAGFICIMGADLKAMTDAASERGVLSDAARAAVVAGFEALES